MLAGVGPTPDSSDLSLCEFYVLCPVKIQPEGCRFGLDEDDGCDGALIPAAASPVAGGLYA
jgi:hypothetical protein